MLNELRVVYKRQLEAARPVLAVSHRFDAAPADQGPRDHVRKTTRRKVVTLGLTCFEAVEVRRGGSDDKPCPRSPLLGLVPPGGTYGYDLIVHVGLETFLRGRALHEVAAQLPLAVPFSSLYDLQHKFLFYLGHLHRQSAPILSEVFRRQGGATWLIDGTQEPDTPMYFGIYEAQSNLLLDAWRIATENAEAITPCLREATARFGRPRRVLHDLSDAMAVACQQAWDDMPHMVCHFHLVRDIGEGLYAEPQRRLRQRLRQLKLQLRLKEQRSGQTDWLREHIEHPTLLAEALLGGRAEVSRETAGREVLLAFHQWILDYCCDGRRQGYPFDPYLLYFHRRVTRAWTTADRLLRQDGVADRVPQAFKNFARMLEQYLGDEEVKAAVAQYEQAYGLFGRLRTVLRMASQGDSPLYDRYLLETTETAQVNQDLEAFREECHRQSLAADHEEHRQQYRIVVEHLDRYSEHLFPSPGETCCERTTNAVESHWGNGKRQCRKRHGRKKLTREFRSLPAEFMLVPNLENPQYVDAVLDGHLNNLASKLAAAGDNAGPWTHWRAVQQPLNTGRLPQRLIRRDNFLDDLARFYGDHCQPNG